MKGTVVIVQTGIVFGVPAELFAIPGYVCIFRAREFAKARDLAAQTDHFICDQGGHWALWAVKYDGEKTEKNPRGEYVDSGHPVIVPKFTEVKP